MNHTYTIELSKRKRKKKKVEKYSILSSELRLSVNDSWQEEVNSV
jgi:hypothetical protein